jgi:tetratricopeptide (TPR) repeat protein
MIRACCFLVYHLLLITLVLALQGCSSFPKPLGETALPWSKPKSNADEITADGTPVNASAAIAKGVNHERAGQYDKAREVYEKMLAKTPDNLEAVHRLGVVADKQRRHDEAQAMYSRVIQAHPNSGELFNDLGYSFYLAGELPKAESALSKAVQLDPENPRFRNNLGMVMGQQGRMQEAFDQFARIGSEADAHYNVAFIYASQNNNDEAKACFLRALAIDPTHAKASKALESFKRFEQNDGMTLDEDYTADGRRLVPYLESEDGTPDVTAMTNFGINSQVDSVMPGKHNLSQNREAGAATRQAMDSSRVERNTASAREAEKH